MDRLMTDAQRPAKKVYSRNRTTFRTIFEPLGMRDPQQAFPMAWCAMCGAEVYRGDTLLCRRCGPEEDG